MRLQAEETLWLCCVTENVTIKYDMYLVENLFQLHMHWSQIQVYIVKVYI